MKDLTAEVRSATSLTMAEFCEKYLDSDYPAFRSRVRQGKVRPNEALLICLITGKNPEDFFGQDAIGLFFLQGKEKVNDHLRKILAEPDAIVKMNLILKNPNGLHIHPKPIEKVRNKPRDPRPAKKETAKPAKKPKPAVSSFDDLVDPNIFK